MRLFVDTSVWSLLLRRNSSSDGREVEALSGALQSGDSVIFTGLVLQELLQGFSQPKSGLQIKRHFAALPMLMPDREDHIAAAELRNTCRSHGVQVGTIDALLAQLCLRHDLILLTTDKDFDHLAKHCRLRIWH